MNKLKIVREGGTCNWIRMVVDGESKTYTRSHFPNFHPTWVYYPDNPYLESKYNSQDQEKLENLFQEYLKEEKND